jgi:hypothetical protein
MFFRRVEVITYLFTIGGAARFFHNSFEKKRGVQDYLTTYLVLCTIAFFLAKYATKSEDDEDVGE